MGPRPSPTGTPAESSGGWEDVSFDKSDGLSVAATSPVRTPTPLHFGGWFDPAEWRTAAAVRSLKTNAGLPARRKRPRHCRAAEKRDELAPFHSITSSARTRIDVGIVMPSAFAVLRLTISSTLVACWTGKSAGFSPLRIRPV